MKNFSIRLKELRCSRNITQNELAQRIGVSKSSVNMYERGEREPSLATLHLLADYFFVNLDDLLGRSAPQTDAEATVQSYRAIFSHLQAVQQLHNQVLCRIFAAVQQDFLHKNPLQDPCTIQNAEDFSAFFQAVMRHMTEAERHDFHQNVMQGMESACSTLAAPPDPSDDTNT